MIKIILVTLGTILVIVGVICTVVVASYFFTRYIADPSTMGFKRVLVTEQTITLEGLFFSNSAGWYAGNTTSYADGVLTVKVYVHALMRFPGDQYMDLTTITLLNTYKDLREIRLGGGGNSADKVIWTSAQ